LPYALDNGRFVVWSKGAEWNETPFLKLLDTAAAEYPPLWIIVPDVVADAYATFDEWATWEPRLRSLGCPLALAVQDGMTPFAVRKHANPDVIFVGGSTDWKRRTIWNWTHSFPRVHIGRVNTEKWLWNAHRCGAESVDGTGFFMGGDKRLAGLHRYLKRSSLGLTPRQIELSFSDTFMRKE
jgi:hypothetical protein